MQPTAVMHSKQVQLLRQELPIHPEVAILLPHFIVLADAGVKTSTLAVRLT